MFATLIAMKHAAMETWESVHTFVTEKYMFNNKEETDKMNVFKIIKTIDIYEHYNTYFR